MLALLRLEDPRDRRRIRRHYPAVEEDGDRGLVGVVDADKDVTMAGQLLRGGRPHQWGESARREQQDRIVGALA